METCRAVGLLCLLCLGCSRTGPLADSQPSLVSEPDAAAPAPPVEIVGPPCILLPRDGSPVIAEFTTPAFLTVVDTMLLVDATGSMEDEIDQVRERLSSFVVPGVRDQINDPAFGLALFGEFPVQPHAGNDVEPYELRVPITRDILEVEGALSTLPTWANLDFAEAQVEALYQVVTGEGLGDLIERSLGCPGGGWGGACFREEALPVILLITDAPFHNGPGASAPYRFEPAPHDYSTTVQVLSDNGVLVVGLGATDAIGPSPIPDLRSISRDTGAVNAEGDPLAFNIGSRGDRLGQGIVDAIEQLATEVLLDLQARLTDVPGDGVDATQLVVAIRPLRAEPANGVDRITDERFIGVQPGTLVSFELELSAGGLSLPGSATVRAPALVTFYASGSWMGETTVELVIEGDDGGGCS